MKYRRVRWKYQVAEGFAYKLQCQYSYLKVPFSTPYFAITATGWLLIFERYNWDGATKFPDFDWIKTPSAIHDALHVAIQLGCIPESDNDLIDKELELAIEGNKTSRWAKHKLLQFRGWYVRKATNMVDEKPGELPPPVELPQLEHELSLREYYRRYGA